MKIQPKTVVQTLEEMLNERRGSDPDLPEFAGRTDGTEADIISVISEIGSAAPYIRLELSDGSKFRIEVHAI